MYLQPPDESVPGNAANKNCHLWLKQVVDAAEAVDLSLQWICTKGTIQKAISELLQITFWEAVRTSTSLEFYSGRPKLQN